MKRNTKILMAAGLSLMLVGIISSCQPGPAEKVGEKIDKAVQDTKDAARDAKEDITRKR